MQNSTWGGQGRVQWLGVVSSVCALVVIVFAVGGLVGALLNVGALVEVGPGWPRMAPATAVAFISAGISLWLTAPRPGAQSLSPRRVRVARLLAVSVVMFAVLRLGGWALGVEHVMLGGAGTEERGVTAVATACGFLGAGLALSARAHRTAVADVAGFAACLVGWLGLSRYVYGGEPLYPFAEMAAHTSAGLLALGLGALSNDPNAGLSAVLTGRSDVRSFARRLVAVALFVPLMLGLLFLSGVRDAWWEIEAGVSLLTLALVVGIGGTTWWAARQLQRADAQRTKVERRVALQLERMHLLHQITVAMAARHDVESTRRVVTAQLCEQLGVHLAVIMDFDSTAGRLTCKNVSSQLSSGTPSWLEPGKTIDVLGNGLASCVKGNVVYEPETGVLDHALPRDLYRAGLNAVVLAPLQVDSETLGVILVASETPRGFSSTDCEFVKQLADHVALSTRQAQLNQALSEAYEDLRTSREAMSKQERLSAVGQLASGIAHDINNAITPIGLYAFMLLEEQGLSDSAREYLKTIGHAVEDVGETLARLRRFYKPRDEDDSRTQVSINAVVLETLELTRGRWAVEPRSQGVKIRVERDLDEGIPLIDGNQSELRDAMTNLILNALDAMPEGGTLTVRTALRQDDAPDGLGHHVIVEVIDTGVGMDAATQERCLEPFYTTKGERGTGLGMAMVNAAVQRYGGVLQLESALGRGTTVRLEFTPTSQSAEIPAVDAPRPRSLRLLVVDDDPVILRGLQKTLADDGHDVCVAGGGREALQSFLDAAETQPFDAVLTDYGMPHLDGAALAAAVKKTSPDTPVFMLTGWGARLNDERSIPQHVDSVLSKPLKVPALRLLLATRFGARGSQRTA